MTSLITRGISIYKEEGAATLFYKSIKKIRRNLHRRRMSIRGWYSLTLDDYTVLFSAPSLRMVHRNQERFNSEYSELRDFISEIEEDDIVYDIGANTGLYTLFAAKAAPDGKVVSFEPYPPNIKLLEEDITRNQLDNVEVIDLALSDSIGSVEFSQPAKDDVGYGLSSIEVNKPDNTIEIPTTTADQLISDDEIPTPNVIKIDVEGSEQLVLNGLEIALSAPGCRTVYCEVHLPGVDERPSIEDFGSSTEDIEHQLEEFGFTVERLQSRDREIFYKASK